MAQLDKLYYINVGKGGTFKPSGNDQFDTTAKHVDAMFEHLKANDIKKLVIYFHGGLVKADAGMETADRIVRYAGKHTTSHPVCFVWETGLFETLSQNFDTIHKSDFFRKLLTKIIKVAGKKGHPTPALQQLAAQYMLTPGMAARYVGSLPADKQKLRAIGQTVFGKDFKSGMIDNAFAHISKLKENK